MKELSIEEKAKRYDEALATARKLYNMRGDWTNLEIESIFPELRESEDERIRKELIDYFSGSHALDNFRGIPWDRIATWLEKQGEQKPAAWSEKDEKMANHIICDIESLKEELVYCKSICDEEITWVKSLKDRVQPKQE